MDGSSVAQIITAITAPLVAAMVARQLSKKDSYQKAAMQTFFRLSTDVDAFRVSILENIAHAFQWEIIARGPVQVGVEREQENGKRALRNLREAVAKIKADRLMIDMLFRQKADALRMELTKLTTLSNQFVPTQKGGRTPDYAEVRDLPLDEQIERVDLQITALWGRTFENDFAETTT
jgi:hypothetical protein